MGEYAILTRAAALLKECEADGASLLVGVSGGPDSVALLHILLKLRQQGVVAGLFAAHMHHGIRGESADRDAAFVRALCGEWHVPLHEERIDAPALSRAQGLTLEEAARSARYDFFRRVQKACEAKFIVTAHHGDDQAETVLMHILRGAGLTGLCGMQPRAGDILRPLLTTSREEILAYLSSQGLAYCTDETNLQPGCLRNRIRLELLPLLQREYNPAIVESLRGMAQLLSQDEAVLHARAERALKSARTPDGGYLCAELLKLPQALRSRAVRIALDRAGALYDMQRGGVERVCDLLGGRTGAVAPLPRGMQARISYGVLYIGDIPGVEQAFETPFLWPGETIVPGGRFVAQYANTLRTDEGAHVAYLDADKLPAQVVGRRRMPGDRFHPLGAAGGRKLKEYLIDKKLPRQQREAPLLAHGGDILFFPGGAISHVLRVEQGTTRILRVEYLPE